MIKSLEIHNYQSHKYSKLEFTDGVNVIIGVSDSGKSAVIKALRWLIWNRPTGDDFRSNWGGETEVKLTIDDGLIIQRIKNKSDNIYNLAKQEYKAFKTEVPEEILRTLNINEINLQQQLDLPFLLSSTPGEVAQHFNKIAHLDQIDNGIRKVQQWIRGIEQDIASNEKQAKQLEEELQNFAHLDVFEEDLEVLEEMQNQLIAKIHSKHKLVQLIDSLRDVTIEIAQKSEILKTENTLDNILKWIENRNIKQREKEQLSRLIHETKQVLDDLQEQKDIIVAEKSVSQLLDLFENQREMKDNSYKLRKLIDNITNTKTEFKLAKIRLEKLQQKFDEGFPEICPLLGVICNQKGISKNETH